MMYCWMSPQYCKMSALSKCLIEKFSILRTVGIYLSIHHKDCTEMENLKNLGDSFFQLHIISVDLKSNFNLSSWMAGVSLFWIIFLWKNKMSLQFYLLQT